MRSVLLVSIGPVQDFIASARRCGDLWFGSWLLSELAKAAAGGIVDALDPADVDALVFPGATARASLSPGSETAVANKILVRVPGDAFAHDVAEAGRAAMESRRNVLADDAFLCLGSRDPKRDRHFLEDRAREQVRDLVEYTWVAVREADAPDGYARARREAERILDARKGTKLWGQPSWSDSVRKSSLDGVRESVLHEDLFKDAKGNPAKAQWLRREYGVRATERLCGVGLLKRAGMREDGNDRTVRNRFLSTPHVAALPLLARCANERDAFERYKTSLRQAFGRAADDVLRGAPKPFGSFGRADGQIFFSGRLAELAEESATPNALTTGLTSAQTALSFFFKDTGTTEPMPYYAVLLADGDLMGRAIAAASTFEQHRNLSLGLAGFATSAATLVEEHNGSLIFAGGDDVLALLPLHTALACADALRRDFATRLSAFSVIDGGSLTLSIGLGISHFIDPMGAALEVARRSERLAKKMRNSLAVILEKRGGSPVEVHGLWEERDGAMPLAARLEAMVEMHRLDAVPDKAGFDLAALATELRGSAPELVAAEVRRILARKQPRHGRAAQVAKENLEKLEAWGLADPRRLADELNLARLFADALDLAKGPLQSKDTHAEVRP